ncbi:MAG: TIGR00269 family protein [Candidatus Nitrosopolaris sp.]|jgi:cytoplasmic tRNA 2-thiolation protein 1
MQKFSMLGHNDKVAVGVSGGKDSLALLYVLKKFFADHNRTDLVAITIDEGISHYRDESLQIVKDFCSYIKVKTKISSYKDLFGLDMDQAMLQRPSEKMTSCSMCGTFRRRAIDIAAESIGANVVATAHNLDDQLQTFMINLLSGDIERIGWIYPEPVQYGPNGLKKVKPFVEIYEHEIVFYSVLREIPFQTEECPYMHESIRTALRVFLNNLETAHAGIKYNAYNSMTKISKILKTSSNGSLTHSKECSICGRNSTSSICSVCKTLQVLAKNNK